MTADNPCYVPRTDPVAYKIPRALLPRLHAIKDYYRAQSGRSVTLIEALERMTAECEATYGIRQQSNT
jgi:hypothetical protein